MASQSSRELALERRKALSTGGKQASGLGSSSPNRVRSASDVGVTRTDASFIKSSKNKISSAPKAHSKTSISVTSTSSHSKIRNPRHISNPSRDLVLARREALSKRGKTADKSQDRTRVDVAKNASEKSLKVLSVNTKVEACCEPCAEEKARQSAENASHFTLDIPKATTRRNTSTKRRAIENPSRSLVLARREALSKHGKSAAIQPTTPAAVARQGNPDLSSREISQRVRELRSKSGATGKKRSCGTRPCGPNKNGSKEGALAADAHWKVGVSQTSSGQLVTGTQANRSIKTTGNEASTCRSVTGTQYLGADTINTFCQTPPPNHQPAKVSLTTTSHGNQVTGNEVGRSEKVTGDEPGTCKNLTGTEYISADQTNSYCGGVNPSPRKVGQSLTQEGRKVSGVMVGRTSSVTGNEAGAEKHLTGDQYLGTDPLPEGRPAEKVGLFNTLSGTSVTGTGVGRAGSVTGDEAGSCKNITGDEYIGFQQYDSFCPAKPPAEAQKVGLSLTNKSQFVSGTMTGRSSLVTGDEPGTCKSVTGTPYSGLEDSAQLCNSSSIEELQNRSPRRLGTPGAPMTGLQPGVGGVMTGAEKGACEPLTGTPYVGADQLVQACGKRAPAGSSNYNDGSSSVGTRFTVTPPARAAQGDRDSSGGVTGTSYERGSNITGPFDMAVNKVTGTEQFRFDSRQALLSATSLPENSSSETNNSSPRPQSRITGEGQSAGLNITGDDWARGERVTGTEGASAKRRNPSRAGTMSAMPAFDVKRNEEMAKPDLLITGSSGNTGQGQLVTFSGGARG
ncbi:MULTISPECIES: CsoS2 family carboxysome shell protein [Prochlorococcus]|uniref:carboxysome assembly protein CsoS2 n=1 Tax=Prochlorococcus TaxID=1218 RepID=UPI000533899D|nr:MULTISPECIES: CsoS2 family carboxysome shell protein [Prochlorococcus]KGG12837.1 carboxysome shell protein CsoS2 [Prochlorococcus sp. MIT 0601]